MNKTYVITGAGSGIGLELVKALANGENTIFAGYRSDKNIEELKKISDKIFPFYIDYDKPETIKAATEYIKSNCNHVDTLVNGAGCVVAGPVEIVEMNEVRHQFNVNVLGHIEFTQGLVELLDNGRIINISSMASFGLFPFISPYCVSKRALDMFFNTFLIENKRNIKVISIKPKLAVAMVNPADKYTIREISLSTGRALNVYCIPYVDYDMYLKEYTLIKKTEQHAKETERIIQSIEEETAQFANEETLWVQVEKELQDSSGNVAKFVYKIITDAIDAKASDIHIEPRLGYYVVRLRSDGMLKKVLEIPGSIEQAVITRFKVLARMNIAEHRRPQDGTFSIKYNDRMYDFRINTLPVSGKEKVVIRILALQ